jgi:hypothetical protein
MLQPPRRARISVLHVLVATTFFTIILTYVVVFHMTARVGLEGGAVDDSWRPGSWRELEVCVRAPLRVARSAPGGTFARAGQSIFLTLSSPRRASRRGWPWKPPRRARSRLLRLPPPPPPPPRPPLLLLLLPHLLPHLLRRSRSRSRRRRRSHLRLRLLRLNRQQRRRRRRRRRRNNNNNNSSSSSQRHLLRRQRPLLLRSARRC